MFRRWLPPMLILSLVWLGITQGRLDSWLLGVPFVLLAMTLFDYLGGLHKPGIRLRVLPGFAVWFLWHSLRGGMDVARRTLTPRLPLRPGFVRYPLALPPGAARVFLINCLSLLPGTLSADLEDDELVLHALDLEQDLAGETRRAERRVAALFAIDEAPS